MALGITPIEIINKGNHPLLVKHTDWERVELCNIADVQNGYAFSSELFNHKDGLPLIRIRDIFSEKTENYYSGEYNEDFVVNHKDILIGMDGDFKISRWPGQKGLLNQRVCRIKFFSNFYLESFLFICVQPYLDAINSETSAVTVKHLSSRTINDIPLPLPPLPIQRAIVSKIETLFSDLDNGIANFKKAQVQLKTSTQI
jgi:type I restriction enzyme S subunit